MVDFKNYYQGLVREQARNAALLSGGLVLVFAGLAWYTQVVPALILGGLSLGITWLLYHHYSKGYRRRLALCGQPFPQAWQQLLEKNSRFYRQLNPENQSLFRQRIGFFLAEKKIQGISTDIDDEVRLLVAASAIIPTFAFPFFEYPNLSQVLVYPNSFDHSFQTARYQGHEQDIAGMVGTGFLNGSLLLSKTDLLAGFQGQDPHNVGIHEFVHLLDMADGAVDGLPEIFLSNAYTLPWLELIRAEVRKIRKGRSDINPYGLTNDAEFLAVVSEYFFDRPEKLAEDHPELYRQLCTIFHQAPARKAGNPAKFFTL
ncbi:MAG: zinc-dependent peptidase [Adhaeribacter sp.]